MDKVFKQFYVALSDPGFLGFNSEALSANYQSCITTSGAIKTIIRMQGADVPADLKQVIDQQIKDMQTRAYDPVKKEIFDWQRTSNPSAAADKGIFGSLFGGSAVSLKAGYQKRGLHLNTDFQIDTTVAKLDTVSGDLNDLEPALKSNLDKYLAIVDIFEHFKKIQVAAIN